MARVNIAQLVADVATELISETKMKVEDRAQLSLLLYAKTRFEGKDGSEAEIKSALMKVFQAAQARAAQRGAKSVDEEDIKAAAQGVHG